MVCLCGCIWVCECVCVCVCLCVSERETLWDLVCDTSLKNGKLLCDKNKKNRSSIQSIENSWRRHAHTQKYMLTHRHTNMHTHMHTHTNMHTQTQTCTEQADRHTRTHTPTQSLTTMQYIFWMFFHFVVCATQAYSLYLSAFWVRHLTRGLALGVTKDTLALVVRVGVLAPVQFTTWL